MWSRNTFIDETEINEIPRQYIISSWNRIYLEKNVLQFDEYLYRNLKK